MLVLEKLWEMLPAVMLKDQWRFRVRIRRLQGYESGEGRQREYERLLKNMEASAKLRQERLEQFQGFHTLRNSPSLHTGRALFPPFGRTR